MDLTSTMNPCYEIFLNGKLYCRAGGKNCIFLSADIGGSHIGPVGLLVHGLVNENSDNPRHVYWSSRTLDENDEVTFKLLDAHDVDPAYQEIGVVPKIAERSNLTLAVRINEKHFCTADIAGLDNVGMSLRWSDKNEFCELDVHSSSNSEVTPKSKEWCVHRLLIGDVINVRARWTPAA